MARTIKVGGVEYHMSDRSYELVCEGAALAEADREVEADPMIEVEIVETGDRAEAETPESAVYAAQVIGREASEGKPWGFDPHIVFRVNDVIVRSTTLRAINRERSVPSSC